MLLRYIQLVDLQAKMKMKAQANKLVLSYLWWVLEPLLFVLMFYVVFEYLLQRGNDDFFIFLMVGKIVYMWFSKSITTACQGLVQNKGIIGQRSIPKWIFPLVNIQESSYKAIISFILLFFVLVVNGYYPHFGYWQLLPLLGYTYLLICGIGVFSAILVAIAKDFANLIQLGMMGVMFGSGIFWDINALPNEQVKDLLFIINPMALIVDGFRQVVMYNNILDFSIFIPGLIFSILLLTFSLYILNRFNNKITRLLFS